MAILAMLTSSCFTGIESTPKITDVDVRRQALSTSPDNARLLRDIAPQPIAKWQVGKAFIVTSPKIGMALTLSPSTAHLSPGDTLRFRSIRNITSILGKPVAEITFSAPDSTTAIYRADNSIETLSSLPGLSIPFTSELSISHEVRTRMLGNDYWVNTSDWLDRNLIPRRGRKFIKVRVIDVDHGDDTYPVLLTLADVGHEPADTFCLLMSIGNGISSTRQFPALLSIDDPHKRYPTITPAMWQLICNGKVETGMTRDEVRLSLGRPINVDRRPGYNSLAEIWTYENGRFIIFEDGLLKTYR